MHWRGMDGKMSSKRLLRKVLDKKCMDEEMTTCVDELVQNLKNFANKEIDSKDETLGTSSIQAIQLMFIHLLINEQILNTASDSDKETIRMALIEDYKTSKLLLMTCLQTQNEKVREDSLETMMKFLQTEISTCSDPKIYLKTSVRYFLREILRQLASTSIDMSTTIESFHVYLDYADIQLCFLRTLSTLLHKSLSGTTNKLYLGNVFEILKNISLPAGENSRTLRMYFPKASSRKVVNYNALKVQFSSSWLNFLSHQLSTSLRRQVLIMLHVKVLPFLENPLLLADFLTQSYNVGGPIGLLALNGLFLLMQDYHLDYPNFYLKLYALFEPQLFHAKYRSRFFYLADLFLKSTHLPAYLVAAFIKRLSRLSLTAPPAAVMLILTFVSNLLARHAACMVLVNRHDCPNGVKHDPYDAEESDPAKCNAMQSSLWELESLGSHYMARISMQASKLKDPRQQEVPIDDVLDLTLDDMFEQECSNEITEENSALADSTVSSSFSSHKDNRISQFWVW